MYGIESKKKLTECLNNKLIYFKVKFTFNFDWNKHSEYYSSKYYIMYIYIDPQNRRMYLKKLKKIFVLNNNYTIN